MFALFNFFFNSHIYAVLCINSQFTLSSNLGPTRLSTRTTSAICTVERETHIHQDAKTCTSSRLVQFPRYIVNANIASLNFHNM